MFSGLCAPLACIAGVERGREEGIKGGGSELFSLPASPSPFGACHSGYTLFSFAPLAVRI